MRELRGADVFEKLPKDVQRLLLRAERRLQGYLSAQNAPFMVITFRNEEYEEDA